LDELLVHETLQKLLAEDRESSIERAKTTLDNLVGPIGRRPVVLFGAGALGRKTLNGLRRLNLEPVAFADNDVRKAGTEVEGIRVFTLQTLIDELGTDLSVIVTVFSEGHRYLSTRERLRAAGVTAIAPFAALAWKFPDYFLPHMRIELPQDVLAHGADLNRALGCFSDAGSRKLFVSHVRWRLHLDFDGLPPPVQHQYFPPDIVQTKPGDVIVDCGAYIGDTLQYALSSPHVHFSRWIAYEPDAFNYAQLIGYVRSLPLAIRESVEARNAAVTDRTGIVRFNSDSNTGSSISREGQAVVNAVALDDEMADQPVALLKLDVEGAEIEALRGAERCIRKNRPIIALELTHNLRDLWVIPSYIKDLTLRYELFLRSHEDDGTDLVLYAVPSR